MADDTLKSELDDRKASVLRAVVRQYIETAQPVGSGAIARQPDVAVSSATVRNDMAALEQEGFLRQPHTSAGRVPTEKGYRFFVDAIETSPALGRPKAEQVRDFFERAHGELEEMLESTSRLLADLTEWTGVVVSPSRTQVTVRSVQFVGLTAKVVLLVVVLSDGTVEKHTLELDTDVGEERLGAATAHLSGQLIGRARRDLPNRVLRTGDKLTDRLSDAAHAALLQPPAADNESVFVGGASHVASAFDAVETVQQVLATLEQQYVVVTVLRDVLDRGLQVAIGTETGLEPLAECSLVVAPYLVEGEPAGSIGILGPTRMNYPEALAAVAVVSNRLTRRLGDDD